MSQRAGDLGSGLMGCGNQSQIDKYGSEKACINNIMFGQPKTKENKGSFWDGFDTKQLSNQPVVTKEDRNRWKDFPRIGGSDTELKVFEMQRLKDEQAKVRKQYIMYGLIAVAGYFAYKKFKK
jgi:hypothetical protein|tara:strand:- start:243 stop:611 length:369 start_codon:yes stop_codon:yes gene_type:complete